MLVRTFDPSLEIGIGGYGRVYRGNISVGKTVVEATFKRLNSVVVKEEHVNAFWPEIHMDEKVLVSEFVANGSLSDHLHIRGTLLSWNPRLRILITAARGLVHLHECFSDESGQLRRKSDVYSFGVVLLEVLSRKRVLNDPLKSLVDPAFLEEISPGALKKYIKLAQSCIRFERDMRPTMAVVAVKLELVFVK
ncbi:hypothetical protein QVD17_02630 [Tagetes erecta]|uniref:Serine-threonine/tyrosine-protein kinase catalytic domain-containing protein n=1 Tax=Tagetes erecta TaxID=13708 RepID=A0AAD8P9C5_TARER|nr:hypothetical protein QVD17_02630 [Tagetes erecta]